MYPAYPYNNPITVSPPRTLEPEISLEPEIALLNHFDNRLPRELKLGIFSTLVDSYEIEHARDIREGRWTTARAGKEKWVGRDAGLKELVKISRVSRAWQCLAFDGQLWSTVQSPRAFPSDLLARISLNAGPFVRVLDLSGCSRVNSAVLLQMTYNFSVHPDPVPVGHGKQVIPADYTNLTTINLQGCSITTYALHQLLTRSPCLKTLCLRGLGAVTNATCELLSDCCAKLVKLDLGRCANMDAGGVLRLAKASQEHGKKPLRELRISGLKRVSDTIMSALARGFPDLEVLDLAGCKDLTNASLKEFVAWSDGDFPVADRLTLTSREMGLDPGDPTKYHKRATKIRHLSISSCSLLTDMACTYLAHSLPLLEIFEFAGLGNAIQDEGLVRLLNTTPMIRKIDLEDAADITDAVLEILTPLPQPEVRRGGVVVPPLPQPGHALESLVVSYANNLTVDALTSLIRACPRLRTLEVDNTQVSDAVVREFVKQCRTRGTADAGISAIDCRGISRGVCTELKDRTRPRRGWRGWDAKKLFYVDAADETKVEQGQDECEPAKVLFKSFFSWQAVDTTLAARAKVRKALASRRDSAGAEGGAGAGSREGGSRSRWLSPFSSRRSSGSNTPASEVPSPWEEDGRGCIVM
ncbi:hypothetical protein BOTBODRAFT_109910 [Botryobasidium botryosum FD-172 SS1]|uniref:F-box domain-containing protein n=1 Tax=Botryobasidium botryosum (strain FD-172 SS1) TaxID=930990 RepID=A0A067MSG9_BOTB1|nr:hypothetical protein BOTBODRAFT_109910 [Botryobasidium botryosum FD-172 SS1]